MIGSISGKIKAKAAFMDPSHYGRSDTSAIGRWFWEIDKVLLLLLAVLIGIGLIAVAAASPAGAHRYSGGNVRVPELYFFWRQLAWIAIGIPVMIGISMMQRERARRWSLFGAAFFFVLLIFVPVLGPEVNGARRYPQMALTRMGLMPFDVVMVNDPALVGEVQPGRPAREDLARGGGLAVADEQDDGGGWRCAACHGRYANLPSQGGLARIRHGRHRRLPGLPAPGGLA